MVPFHPANLAQNFTTAKPNPAVSFLLSSLTSSSSAQAGLGDCSTQQLDQHSTRGEAAHDRQLQAPSNDRSLWYHPHTGRSPGCPPRDHIFFIMKLFRAGITSACEEEAAIREGGREDEILDGDRNDLDLSLLPAVVVQTLLLLCLE